MKCPYCVHEETKVVDSRESVEDATRRRRECLKCSKRFTTYERIEHLDITVIKRDGRKEAFSRDKLLKGIVIACEKRPIESKIEKLVDAIELSVKRRKNTEVTSQIIGDLVMKKLLKLDKIAYMRFASIYRDFENIREFEKELKVIVRRRK